MDANKIKLTMAGEYMTTAADELQELYVEEINRQAGDELCSDICALFGKGFFDVRIHLAYEEGEIMVRRLKCFDKKDIESLGFYAPCYTEPLKDEDADISEFTLPNGHVIRTKTPKKKRAVALLPYEVMTIKHAMDEEHHTEMAIDLQFTDKELANESQDLENIAIQLPRMLTIYLAMHFDGKIAAAKDVATKYAQGDTITLDEKWNNHFTYTDYEKFWSRYLAGPAKTE